MIDIMGKMLLCVARSAGSRRQMGRTHETYVAFVYIKGIKLRTWQSQPEFAHKEHQKEATSKAEFNQATTKIDDACRYHGKGTVTSNRLLWC